jgi:hypothetical protein
MGKAPAEEEVRVSAVSVRRALALVPALRAVVPAFSVAVPALSVAVVALSVVLAGAAAAKSYRAESYRSDIRLLEDGSLRVNEEIRFRFEGGPFHTVYRILPLRRTDGIDEITSPDPVVIRQRSSEIDLRWNFDPVTDTVRTIVLTYHVRGAIYQKDGKGALRWIAFPREHEYRIDSAQAFLVFPPGSPPSETVETVPRGISQSRTAAGILFDVGTLHANRTIEIDASLPAPAAEPEWQAFHERWMRRVPSFLAVAALILVAGMILIAGIWRRYVAAASPLASGGPPPLAIAPPSDLSPALAGALRDGRASFTQEIATLLDLARRGFIRFEETGRTSIFKTSRKIIRRLDIPESPSTWEEVVLAQAFRDAEPSGAVTLGKAWRRVYRAFPSFRSAVEEELERRGDFDPAVRLGMRRLYGLAIGGAVLTVLSIVWTIVLFGRFGPAPIALAFAFGIVAITSMGIAGVMPLFSERGRDESIRWKGFALAIRRSAKERTPIDAERFTAWLSYAAAFGFADTWMRAGSRWGIAVPDWLRSAPGSRAAFDAWIPIFMVHGGGGAGVGGGGGGAAGGGASGAS